MTARALPDAPALPEHSTDATGVLTGNADLVGGQEWTPPTADPERPTLPGHEHQLDPGSKVFPWLTENRALAISGVLAVVAAALRLGGLS